MKRESTSDLPVTQEQLDELAAKTHIALRGVMDALEVIGLDNAAFQFIAPEVTAKISQLDPY